MTRPSIPQPAWKENLPATLQRLIELKDDGQREAVDDAVAAADSPRGYSTWDEFRRRPAPEGWEPESLWALVKVRRLGGTQRLPLLLAKDGRPFWFHASGPLLAALHRIEIQQRLWHDLLAASGGRDDNLTYRLLAELDEAHHSSAIEGAVTTRRQSKELIRSGREPKTLSERMVLNTWRTLERLGEWTDQPLSVETICAIQASITEGTLDDPLDAGRPRQGDDVRIVDAETGDTVYVPPPAAELEQRLQRLCRFANGGEDGGSEFVHPVVRAMLVHHQLAYDHPFVDGNGRTARALFMWSILRADYRWFSALSISRAVNRSRDRYYRSFRDVQQDEGDTTYFLRDQLRCIEHEIETLSRHLEHRARLGHWIAGRAALGRSLNARQLALLDHLLANPEESVSAQQHKAYHGVSQPTAWKDLSSMVAEGLLRETRQGRRVSYSATAKLRSLAEDRPS